MNFQNRLNTRDPGQMLKHVFEAPERAENCWQRGQEQAFDIPDSIQQILVCGMGGSGSCGDMLQALCLQANIPIVVNKSAELPHWVNQKTLVIAVSYSGNTHEVLTCVAQALQQQAPVLALGAGGQLQTQAQTRGFAFIEIPGGLLPRAALFDLLFALLGSVSHNPVLGLESSELIASLKHLRHARQNWYSSDFSSASGQAQNQALWLAMHMMPWQQTLLWGAHPHTDMIALRWKNQLSENAKTLAAVSSLPELNHNEIVAICARHHSQSGLLYFTLNARISETASNKPGSESIVLDLVKEHVCAYYSVYAEGANRIEKILFLVYLGDFVSVYLAFLKDIDPSPIAAIDELKRRMFA